MPNVVILGHYRAAADYALSHGLARSEWTPACSKESALRALMGADPTTEIVYVHGSENVWSPEFEARHRNLAARRQPIAEEPESVARPKPSGGDAR